jgi:hypothetical protein
MELLPREDIIRSTPVAVAADITVAVGEVQKVIGGL